MYSASGSGAPIDLLLDDAYVAPVFDQGDMPTAAQRIARAARDEWSARPTVDDAIRAERERLAYELNLTCALVLGDAGAASALAGLGDDALGEPEGALVFGALLHLTDRAGASRFWWKYAAGAGIHLAAYCLYLHHGQAAEYPEARFWRDQAGALKGAAAAAGGARGEVRALPARPCPGRGPLLPPRIYGKLLVQCWLGHRPRLPLDIEAVVNQLLVECDDTDFGEIPQPSAQLPTALAARG